MLDKLREDEVIQLCQKLVQAKSYSGEEDKVSDGLTEFFYAKRF